MPQMLLDYYKAIEDSSSQMLEAARVQDWDGVVRFESTCAVLIEQLRACARESQLDVHEKVEKTKIMLRILKNDAQIRHLAEPWLEHCNEKFGGQRYLH
jgi:flagellar protein FliT